MVYQDGDGTWESFSDGKASPSMEYKQIQSVGDGGSIGLGVFGKNLCPISSTSELNKGNASGNDRNFAYATMRKIYVIM